jgi:hypothetical protein
LFVPGVFGGIRERIRDCSQRRRGAKKTIF